MNFLHRWSVWVALAAFFIACSPVMAQWQTPDHSVPVGRGAGTGFKSVGPCNAGVPALWANSSSDPACTTNPTWTGNHTFSGSAYFGSGRPWVDVKAFGAVGNGSTDDTAAMQAAVDHLQVTLGTGGTVFVPPGTFCSTAGTLAVNNLPLAAVRFVGTGPFSSILSACGGDSGPVLTMSQSQSTLENIFVNGKGVGDTATFGATYPAVKTTSTCVNCKFLNVYIVGGSVPLLITADDVVVENSYVANGYGASGGAIVSQNSAALWLKRVSVDQSAPTTVTTGASIGTWAAATAYTAGQMVTTGAPSYVIQATVGGTSGGVAPTLKNFNQDITDSSVTWRLVAPADYCGLRLDTGSFEPHIHQSDFSGFYPTAGICLTNTLAGAEPEYVNIESSVVSVGYLANIYATLGRELKISGTEIVGCTGPNCSGLYIGGSYTGLVSAVNNIVDNNPYGIYNAGGADNVFSANKVYRSSVAGIYVAANVSDFNITNNMLSTATNIIGIQVAAGTSNNYNITGNNVALAGTPLSDGGTGVRKTVASNTGVDDNVWSITSSKFEQGNAYAGTFTSGTLGQLRISYDGTSFGIFNQESASGRINFYNSANNALGFGTNNTGRFEIGAAGGFYSYDATGGSKGLGTGNFHTGLWVDNVAVLVSGGALGTPASGVATNLTGTASGLTAGTVTTNANLTGPITSSGNATSIASQTGTGTTFVMSNQPTIAGDIFVTAMTQTSAPQSGTLCYNSATGQFTYDASLGCLSSTLLVKRNIKPLVDGLATVMALRPISYQKKPEYAAGDDTEQPGLIAEEVAEIDRKLVAFDRDGNVRGVRYAEYTAVLTKALQELKLKNDKLEACNSSWKCRILGLNPYEKPDN